MSEVVEAVVNDWVVERLAINVRVCMSEHIKDVQPNMERLKYLGLVYLLRNYPRQDILVTPVTLPYLIDQYVSVLDTTEGISFDYKEISNKFGDLYHDARVNLRPTDIMTLRQFIAAVLQPLEKSVLPALTL